MLNMEQPKVSAYSSLKVSDINEKKILVAADDLFMFGIPDN